MRVAFCCAEDINLGAGYIITYLKSQRHKVRLFFDPLQFRRGYARNILFSKWLSVESYNIRKIMEYRPDMCCFTCVTATYKWGLRMAEKIKNKLPDCKILFGGVHTTLVPEEVKRHNFIDEVVVGDGIEYFGGKFDPDIIWPDREIFLKELPPEHRKIQLFMTSFGCPFNCSFCGNEQLRKIKQFKFIRRSVEGCIKELEHLKSNGAKYILFVDDIFTCDKKWLAEFLPIYKEKIGLPFSCFIHAKFINEEIAQQLKAAGCHTAWMGIQTGHEQLRREILHRNETNKEIIEAAQAVKKVGIKLMIDHIFGIPRENMLTQDVSYAFYHNLNPDIVNCYELLYFPKAKIIDYAVQYGNLAPGDSAKIDRGEGIVYQQNNKGNKFFDTYAKGMITIPLRNLTWELLPTWLIKLIIYIKAGRGFTPIAMIQNEIYFSWRAILKKLRII